MTFQVEFVYEGKLVRYPVKVIKATIAYTIFEVKGNNGILQLRRNAAGLTDEFGDPVKEWVFLDNTINDEFFLNRLTKSIDEQSKSLRIRPGKSSRKRGRS